MFTNLISVFGQRSHNCRTVRVKVCCTILLVLSIFSFSCSAKCASGVSFDEFRDVHVPIYTWSSQQDSKAIILGIHGGCLDGNTFSPIAKLLNAHGYSVVAIDMRGYGKWYHLKFGTRRDTTFHYTQSVNDIELVLSRLRVTHPGIPLFIMGESLGANMAFLVAARRPDLVDGVVAVSLTSLKVFFSPRMVFDAIKVVTRPTAKLDIRPYLKNRLANDSGVATEHFKDPLGRDWQSFPELARSIHINMVGLAAVKHVSVDLPTLCIFGAKDRISHASRSMKIAIKAPTHDKEVVLFPDNGHVMIETPLINGPAVLVISHWLDRHVDSSIAAVEMRP